jgi:hypothetical protein
MKRTIKAIQVFIDYWEENAEIISKQEFDLIWKGSTKYYYKIRKDFLNSLKEVKNNAV